MYSPSLGRYPTPPQWRARRLGGLGQGENPPDFTDTSPAGSALLERFWSAWASVKDRLSQIANLPQALLDLRMRWTQLRTLGLQTGDQSLAAEADAGEVRTQALMDAIQPVADIIHRFLPEWSQADFRYTDLETRRATRHISGLGQVVQIVMSVAAVAAIAYVATVGMDLLRQYFTERSILEGVEAKKLNPKTATALLAKGRATGGPGFGFAEVFGEAKNLIIAGGVVYLGYFMLSRMGKRHG